MNIAPDVTLVVLGFSAGSVAGLLGVGGGVVLFPLLLYMPSWLGLGSLDAKSVAAVAASQVFFSSVVGGGMHWRNRRVHPRLVAVSAAAAMVTSFFGGIASKFVSDAFLLVLFGFVTVLAAGMMFLPICNKEGEDVPLEKVLVPVLPLTALSAAEGLVVGFLGAGNFLFVPLLICFLRIPTRVAIGSNLAIAVLTTFSGFLGKLVTGQIPFVLSALVVAGATAGVLIGERAHGRVSPLHLRHAYTAIIALVAASTWLRILA